ncbi:MAG: hypothetical protein COV47_01785 [Candidatus Diapherotrites archaeon CG11_big_fil_rev_8_21_14_0_20_37_9]|nr:MAG: hypothetical protein COV47_01785 [Candidatus Diapherotrites archaeon CG11_big_fil_rev_8_21_14_0_20_37_9]
MKNILAILILFAIVVSGCTAQPQAQADDSMMEDTYRTGDNSVIGDDMGDSMGDVMDDHMGDTVGDAMDDHMDDMMGHENTIEFTETGYVPNELTIKVGDTVTWVNKTQSLTWPASAKHPTHTAYPGSDIQKCGTDEQAGIFDACAGFGEGESYSFTFNEPGEWFYHDHLNASKFGKIIVKAQ